LSYTNKNVEDYLKAIYKLEEVLGLAKTGDIAKELGVTAATVSKTLKRLEVSRLIERLPYEGVKLSSKGKTMAITIIKKHRLAEYFLHYYLKFDLIKAHIYAHMLEHMPEDFFDKLWIFMNKPSRCPHGNIIPGLPEYREEDLRETTNDNPLPKLREGAWVKITRILCSFQHKLIEQLIKADITVGSIVYIEKIGDYSIAIRSSSNSTALEIPMYQANFIRGIVLNEK
jgi:DtxR family Mn-dependent transcriptional regulator